MGEVMEIDWRDKDGGWTKFILFRIIMDTLKPLCHVVCIMDSDRSKMLCVIKYEKLLVFCYICGCIGYNNKKCASFPSMLDPKEF